jgi:hypothetical protein
MDSTRVFRMAFASVYPHLHHQGGEEGSYDGGGACHHPLTHGLR